MGASLALGGMAGCSRFPEDKVVPYVNPPENKPMAGQEYYATAMPVEGFARGILVASNLGRPTKIEGNPDHPESLGATDAVTQAAILSLYDPDRSRTPVRDGRPGAWRTFEEEWDEVRGGAIASGGKGMAVLTEPTSSPSLLREIGLFLAAFPEARWYQHTALAGYEVDGIQPDYDLERAEIVFSIGGDFLFRHPACLRYSRALARRRRVAGNERKAPLHYALEPTPTVTGAMADFRLPASPGRLRFVLDAVAHAVEGGPADRPASLSEAESQFVESLGKALRLEGAVAVCLAGPEQDGDVQRWALAMNDRLAGGTGAFRANRPVRSDNDRRAAGNLEALAESMARGDTERLIVLGPNPAYTAPASLGFSGLLGRVPFAIHLGSHRDETGALCRWHLPEADFLETWMDLRAYGGSTAILQPLIEPLFEGRSALEVLRRLREPGAASGYEIVRETCRENLGTDAFETRWAGWLQRGLVDGAALPAAPGRSLRPFPIVGKSEPARGKYLVLAPDPSVLDGRWANNAWLQELPKPLNHLVWDNAATLSPALASELGVQNGDIVRLSAGPMSLEAAAWVAPGQAADCIGLTLGYGRTRAGVVGNNRGFDAYQLRPAGNTWMVPGLSVARTGRQYPLVTTQHHFEMAGRAPVRIVAEGQRGLAPSKQGGSLFPPWEVGAYAWGMSIDLNACIGCNACVVACQAENNIPVVGKDQVSRGREMHWIRIDQYFEGSPDNPRVLHQPVPCMHCENAPCELVCPVAATVHSSEGLNQMVYNRCVGTRYCSNNCPYKVRRFNFLDYRSGRGSLVDLQKNPDVTVRERGVMEKCTYCVQRINAARIAAEKDQRTIRDGEIRTACEQACPVEAIVFGNVADPNSRVSRLKRDPTDYSLLGEQNTRPRTTYLAKVRRSDRGSGA